ncbi:hypothetical protein BDV26DRAFT_295403 [Aspergillus bertholletiae]|uniref:Rhodopsin domain-containing protein n=1 Tax=Aspergillus bertholletiae TaxID=1226010 RepID=A0A5N7B109_9EURO|nr:hypothetical protein BDV26DRAFT_295403 [Aspergillus bertholletiae]
MTQPRKRTEIIRFPLLQSYHFSTDVLLWGLYLIALIFMILRIASRISIRERLKADDYFAFSSFALLSVGTAIHTAAVSPYIDGFNIAQNNPNFKSTVAENPALREDAIAVFRYSFATLIIFWLTVWCVKFSMLFFIRPIMVPIPVYLEGWYIVFGFTVMNLIGCFIIQFFGCLPFGLNFSFKNDNCVSGNSTEPGKLYGTTALDTLSDMMIVILPTRHLFELPATKKQKAGLVVIFALGWIIIAFSLVRAIHATTAGNNILGPINQRWLAIWSHVECVVAVTVVCLPPIWVGYRKRWRRVHESSMS